MSLPLWKEKFDDAEKSWEEKAKEAARLKPLKKLTVLPEMVGITEETAKGLKWKSLKWMITKDHQFQIFKGFIKHPLRYGWAFIRSAWQTKPYKRDGDFFYYGIDGQEDFRKLAQEAESILILGFSYCHKPFECPSGRFSSACNNDPDDLVCRQCFIGKAMQASTHPRTIPLIIPTIHYIGGKIFDVVHSHPGKRILFMITACEMTLEMFGDWGNMVNIKGIGIRLGGRICNTMRAFELSERGIKPGLTVVLEDTQKRMLELLSSDRIKPT
ncbi:MAG: hypothetical protein LW832_02285 [Parachlamydia sp.]|jgi:hypothetical protein|nr:hypothetical protein [Parachlamydia sp.]